MKHLITAFVFAVAFAAPAFANSHKEAPAMAAPDAMAPAAMTPQQSKMGACNASAGDKKGDERKAFMKECLSAKSMAATTQQDKMKACNKDAAGMKGDDRKAFMKSCLSK